MQPKCTLNKQHKEANPQVQMTATGQPTLTDAQAAVYDRQLRVWGVEVQNRLTAAKVLIIGGNGMAAEVAKNIVLAGVGHVGIMDSTPCSQAPFGNFLVPADAPPESTVAEASARTLQGMNPFVEVGAAAPSSSGACGLTPEVLQQYDTVLSTLHGIVTPEAMQLEEACCASGKHLFLSQSLGLCSTTYVNLGGKHTFSEKSQPQPQQEGDKAAAAPSAIMKEVSYPSLPTALSKPLKECLGRRPVHAMYQVLRVMRAHSEAQQGQQQGPDVCLAALEATAAALEHKEGVPRNSIDRACLSEFAEAVAGVQGAKADVMACLQGPTAAVVGGVVANAIVRAISKVGAPLCNFFFFSPADGQGVVEDVHCKTSLLERPQ